MYIVQCTCTMIWFLNRLAGNGLGGIQIHVIWGTNQISMENRIRYSVCSLVVPTLEEAILTSVLKKNFKWPSILGQEGHSYSPKHSNLSYDQFGGGLEQSDTAPLLLPPGWRDTDSFSWICSVFNSSISRRSWNLFLCPCKWALRLKERWLNRWTWTTKRRTRPPTRWWTTCLQAR